MSNSVINRIKRFPIVIFLKKLLFPLIAIGVIALTFLIGLWDIKRFEYVNTQLQNVSTIQLDEYVKPFVNRNIFFIAPTDIENVILNENGYIKSVTAKKVLPSTISLSIEEYTPYYVGYSSNACKLFSKEGAKLEDLCNDCEDDCLEYTQLKESVYVLSDSILENSKSLIFAEEFSMIGNILNEFGYSIKRIDIVDGITKIEDIDEHIFVFDMANDLKLQLSRMYLVGERVNREDMKFKSLDLRFERPVMKLK